MASPLSLLSSSVVMLVVTCVPAWAAYKKVAVYEAFVEGARGSLDVAANLVPYLVGMIVAVGMLRDSGAVDLVAYTIGGLMDKIGYPSELLPLSLLRPFSGAAANAIMFDLIAQYGPDSLIGLMGATIMAATETTFYMAAVYFGAVGITRMRHAVLSSLVGEVCGMIAAVVVCRWLYG